MAEVDYNKQFGIVVLFLLVIVIVGIGGYYTVEKLSEKPLEPLPETSDLAKIKAQQLYPQTYEVLKKLGRYDGDSGR